MRGVHHHHVVGGLGDDPQVVGDQDHREPKSSCSRLSSARICAWVDVERRRRLVGDDQVRVVDERHRDHHPLAHAARELMGIVVDPPLGARDADRLEHLARAFVRLLAREVPVQEHRLGELPADLVDRFSDVIGSWKIIAIPFPRTSRSRCAETFSRSSPRKSTSPLDRASRGSFSPITVRQVTLLPEPDSPTMPSTWPGSTVKLTPSTAFTIPSSVTNSVRRSRTSRRLAHRGNLR